HEALGALSGQTAITLAHGYQSVKTYQKAFDAELARRGATRLRALGRINAVANSASDIDLTLTTAADAIAEEMDADLCAIFLFDEATRELQLRATNGLLPSNGSHYTRALGQGYSGWVAEHGEPIMVADALADSRFSDEASAYPIELHGLISAPIIFFTSDTLEGALSVQTRAPRAFTQDEVTFLEIAAGQIAMSIENGRLLATNDLEFRRKLQELNTLYRASALVASSLKRDNVLRMIVEQAVVLCNAERSVVFELERIEGNQPNARNQPPMQLRVVASHGFAEFADDELPQLFLPVGECCLALAAREGQPMMRVDCMRRESGCYFFGRSAAIDNQHVVVAAPLNTVHGSLGLLCVLGGQRHVLSDQQRQLMLTFANVAAIAIENARLYEAASEGLRTKEILLREMHHRVKNNLQQVKSILNLTRNRVHSPEMEQVLGESMDRIQGIAAAHELLSTGRLGMAPIEEISRRIVAISRTNAAAPTLRLRFRIGRAPYYLPTDQTTTLAIVLNELVANAIEHGFEGRTSGEISINVAHEDERIVVQVADNGAGLPPGFSVTRAGGLGLELVNRLVSSDLRGSFQMYETTQDPGAGGERVTDPALPVVTAGDESEPQRWTVAEIAFPASLLATPPAEFVG
ncbi:MAG TPA: GAF domain-containing protein, partial [Ktedonobacterales bacterium]|nr:GAF domain-containing protein [Ktedonobacterales bacterium]